jgi:hypothetical protein
MMTKTCLKVNYDMISRGKRNANKEVICSKSDCWLTFKDLTSDVPQISFTGVDDKDKKRKPMAFFRTNSLFIKSEKMTPFNNFLNTTPIVKIRQGDMSALKVAFVQPYIEKHSPICYCDFEYQDKQGVYNKATIGILAFIGQTNEEERVSQWTSSHVIDKLMKEAWKTSDFPIMETLSISELSNVDVENWRKINERYMRQLSDRGDRT